LKNTIEVAFVQLVKIDRARHVTSVSDGDVRLPSTQ